MQGIHPLLGLSLPTDVEVVPDGKSGLTFTRSRQRATFRGLPAAVAARLKRLVHPGEGISEALAIDKREPPETLSTYCYYVQELAANGLMLVTISIDGQRLLSLAPAWPFSLKSLEGKSVAGRRLVLSRFAYIRRDEDKLYLESPLSPAWVRLEDARVVALLHAISRSSTLAELEGRALGLEPEAIEAVLRALDFTGVLSDADADGVSAEDASRSLGLWEFHDLVFHARSREGRHAFPLGVKDPLPDRSLLPPAVKQTAAPGIALYRPDLEELDKRDPPLARVIERRRSIREYGDRPINVRQLGEFLFRVARVKDRRSVGLELGGGGATLEIVSRPYPAGGSLYELEIYPVVQACTDLAPGIYHYDALDHALGAIGPLTPDVGRLIAGATYAASVRPDRVQLLLVIAARFQRVSWKYTSIAYSLMLKHVGVLIQTMYLTATAMDLAPCGLGTGNSDLFARVTGNDYYAETSVGEFLLGSAPPSSGS